MPTLDVTKPDQGKPDQGFLPLLCAGCKLLQPF